MDRVLDLSRGSDLALALLPELILTAWAMMLCLVAAWRHRSPNAQRLTGWLSVAGIAIAIAATIWLWQRGVRIDGIATTVAVDGFRWAATLIILVGTGLTSILAIDYLEREGIGIPEFHALMLFAAVGMMFMVSGADLLIVFLGLETMSVSVYVLAGINRKSPYSAEAALKYFLLGAFASAFLLYGIALIYGATATTKIGLIGLQLVQLEPGVGGMLWIGIALLLVGFAFKIAVVPFHMWAPDVYDGAPTPVTAFMATTVKAAALGALVRVVCQAIALGATDWATVLWYLAATTMIVGNLLALAQRSLKRMLAYSSIAHAGYILAAVVPGSVTGAGAFLFYLMFYTITTVAAFAVLAARGRGGERDVTTDDLSGLSDSHPLLAFIMAVAMLSLLGFPGTAGFIGKWYILGALTAGEQTKLSVILVLTSVISAGYYLPVIMAMYMKPPLEAPRGTPLLARPAMVMITLLTIATVGFGIWPTAPLVAARRAASESFLPASPVNVAESASPRER